MQDTLFHSKQWKWTICLNRLFTWCSKPDLYDLQTEFHSIDVSADRRPVWNTNYLQSLTKTIWRNCEALDLYFLRPFPPSQIIGIHLEEEEEAVGGELYSLSLSFVDSTWPCWQLNSTPIIFFSDQCYKTFAYDTQSTCGKGPKFRIGFLAETTIRNMLHLCCSKLYRLNCWFTLFGAIRLSGKPMGRCCKTLPTYFAALNCWKTVL